MRKSDRSNNSRSQKHNRPPMNHRIRAKQVLCIDENDTNLGTIDIGDALRRADNVGLDLVQVSKPSNDKPPTCKIIDYGKYLYDLSKKNKDKAKNRDKAKQKEIRFRPFIGQNDLEVKAKKIRDFLNDGMSVKISVRFKGREMSHKEIAFVKLNDLIGMVNLAGLSDDFDAYLSSEPKMSGRMLIAVIAKKRREKIREIVA